jgi:hypothetical protein
MARPLALAATVATGTTTLTVSPATAQVAIEARGYGDAGTTELAVGLGFGSNYFSAGGGVRHFVIDGLAPGIEGNYQRVDGFGQGLLLGTLRLAPLRFGSIVPVITARAGRVFISDHADGWAAGGDLGVLLLLNPHVALELGYGFLRLFPDSFCDDFVDCTLTQPVLGVRITF